MTDYPKVSVVTITYGHENYITQTLDGVLVQDYPGEIEFIIANDNSPDSTDKVINEYLASKKIPDNFTIKYTKHKNNLGMIPNFFWAAEQVTSNYIAFCEGDDYWADPLKLQKQVLFLEENTEFGLVVTDFNILHQSTGKTEESLFKNHPERFPIYRGFEEFLLAAGFMAPCTWLLRKNFLPLFQKDYIDGTFPWLLDIYVESRVHVLSDTTATYRYLAESASHTTTFDKRYKLSKGILEIQLDYINKYQLPENYQLEVLKRHYQLLLPTLLSLNLKDEIKSAKIYIPKNQRTIKDHILFFIEGKPLVNQFLRGCFFFKGIK
ncbi:glycosyltransferase family 2 protein [Kaistella sp.]|uniref:glycosyltransferase family 2 protein n=1 Tax=Kaistella sp. TaxID=2782235 RepID=UPI003C598052